MIEENIFRYLTHKFAKKSPCLSRHYGAILVNSKNKIISVGYNRPVFASMICEECPRKKNKFPSGKGLFMCPAVHAEIICLINTKMEVENSTLYVSGCIPCKDCLSALILAGISGIVCEELTYYDELSKKIHQNSDLLIRKYKEIN